MLIPIVALFWIAEILIFCIGLYRFALLNDKRENLSNFNESTDYLDREMARVVNRTFWYMVLCLVVCSILIILVV